MARPLKSMTLVFRGEALIALIAMALLIVQAGGIGAAMQWLSREQDRAAALAEARYVGAVSETLARGLEIALANGDLSAARRLLIEAGTDPTLEDVSLSMPDGTIVAAANTSRIETSTLPETWDGTIAPSRGGTDVRHRISVAGQGELALRVIGTHPARTPWSMETLIGVAAIGLLEMLGLVAVYRWVRRRVRSIGVVRSALMAWQGGERSVDDLAVAPELGPEARAWTELVEERATIAEKAGAEGAVTALTVGSQGDDELSAVIDAMWQGVLLIDEDLSVRFANGAASVYLETEREELHERPLSEVLPNEAIVDAVRNAVSRSVSGRQSVEISNEDASTVLRFGIRPMRSPEGALVLIEDVTQQRIADEARNGFVAQATHELRTPLTNIRLYLEEAIDAPEDDVRAGTRAFDVINDECRRLERIVTDMLSASEIEAGALSIRPGDVRLDAIFEDLEKDYAAQAREKEIMLCFDLPPKLPVIQGDRDKLVMALHNIIGNALKYTPAGGQVNVGVNYDNDMLQVDVKDSGIGIDEEDATHIFDKFYRARDKRIAHVTGTGLGLAIAREVIRLHGGDITVQSELNKGSTFSLLVPQKAQAA